MDISPLAAAAPVIQLHVLAAGTALFAGIAVLASTKGTPRHRRIGWIFVVAMAITALSSIFITRDGHFSAIHLLTLLTLVALPRAVISRRRSDIRTHRSAMIGLFAGLAIAGAFTLLPGRLMHQMTFGQPPQAR